MLSSANSQIGRKKMLILFFESSGSFRRPILATGDVYKRLLKCTRLDRKPYHHEISLYRLAVDLLPMHL